MELLVNAMNFRHFIGDSDDSGEVLNIRILGKYKFMYLLMMYNYIVFNYFRGTILCTP